MNSVSLKNVSLTYHSKESETLAVDNISFDITDNELVGIVGPSGCGKTTILSLIAGLLKPSEGEILINGKPIEEGSNVAGYMLQRDHLLPWRNIWRNVTLGLEVSHRRKDELALRFAKELIEKYGLKDFVTHYPGELSGGMRQRVALIRTLVTMPKILLLDEPFSALDFQTRLKVCEDVHEIIKHEGKTAVFITHDISEAISLCDRIIVLSQRPAHIKDIIDVGELKNLSPLARRENALFSQIFEKIWGEL